MQRAISICKHISRPVVMFSAQPKPASLPDNVTYIDLVSDAVADYTQPTDSAFHYTPYDSAIFDRNQQLIDAWLELGIRELYVDVSAEVAILAKLYGLIVGYAVMPGTRTDRAHSYAYDAADYLLAHCAPQFDDPTNRKTTTKTHYSGGISRFKKSLNEHDRNPVLPGMPSNVVVTMSPKAEQNVAQFVLHSAQHFPDTTWHIVGSELLSNTASIEVHGVLKNPQLLYEQADIIIGSGGTNTIMEVASVAKPFICIPEPRPFDEQLIAAQNLQRLHAALYMQNFPKPSEWQGVIDDMRQIDLMAFSDLVSDDAAAQAAKIIESVGKL